MLSHTRSSPSSYPPAIFDYLVKKAIAVFLSDGDIHLEVPKSKTDRVKTIFLYMMYVDYDSTVALDEFLWKMLFKKFGKRTGQLYGLGSSVS